MDEETKKTLEQLSTGLKTLADNQTQLQGVVGQLAQTLSQNHQKSTDKPTQPEPFKMPSNEDLEAMDRAGLVTQVIVPMMTGVITEQLKPLAEGMKTLDQSISKRDLQAEFKAALGNHKDLVKWQPEIKQRLQQTPGLTIEEAYTLARQSDPKKADEVDKEFKLGKYVEDSNADKDGGKDKTNVTPLKLTKDKDGKMKFGGMQPSKSDEGGDLNANPEEGSMNQTDAFNDAWDKALAQSPGASEYLTEGGQLG